MSTFMSVFSQYLMLKNNCILFLSLKKGDILYYYGNSTNSWKQMCVGVKSQLSIILRENKWNVASVGQNWIVKQSDSSIGPTQKRWLFI